MIYYNYKENFAGNITPIKSLTYSKKLSNFISGTYPNFWIEMPQVGRFNTKNITDVSVMVEHRLERRRSDEQIERFVGLGSLGRDWHRGRHSVVLFMVMMVVVVLVMRLTSSTVHSPTLK